jgi:hypothetical protein
MEFAIWRICFFECVRALRGFRLMLPIGTLVMLRMLFSALRARAAVRPRGRLIATDLRAEHRQRVGSIEPFTSRQSPAIGGWRANAA